MIKEDVLGLNMIYVQAKRWGGTVGRLEIQKCAGSQEGQRARKGVFITATDFTEGAEDYVKQMIILTNGKDLVDYMLEYNIGISRVINYTIKKLDLNYFEK